MDAGTRAAAIVAACDRALERLAGVSSPEIEPLRRSVEAFREQARLSAAAETGPRGVAT